MKINSYFENKIEMMLRGESRRVPLRTYAFLALTTVATMGFSNASLGYLNYPTQVAHAASYKESSVASKPVLWIRIRMDSHSFGCILDPDPYRECRSGSSSMEIDQNFQIDLLYCLSKRYFYFVGMLFEYGIFSCKNSNLCDQDPDPDSHSSVSEF
jgi:hypothetical protein